MKDIQERDSFENKLRFRVGDYEESASSDSWDGIEKRLDKKSKRKFLWIFFALTAGLGILGGSDFFNITGNETLSAGSSSVESKELSKNDLKIKNKTNAVLSEKLTFIQEKKQNSPQKIESKKSLLSNKNKQTSKSEIKLSGNYSPENNSGFFVVPAHHSEMKFDIQFTDSRKKAEQIDLLKTRGGNSIIRDLLADQKFLQTPDPIKFEADPADIPEITDLSDNASLKDNLWTLSVYNSALFSGMRMKDGQLPLSSADLRMDIESSRLNYSGGLILFYELAPGFNLGSGILLTNFSRKVTYDVIHVNEDPYTSGIQYESKFSNSTVYKNPGDSIITGSRHSFTNRYYFREVPLLFRYESTGAKKLGYFMEGGASWMVLSTISAAIVDLDHVGFMVTEDKNAFPGAKNTVNLNLSAGVNLNLGNGFTLKAGPALRYSVRSTTDSKYWTQDYPLLYGLNTVLSKRLF